MITVCCAVNVTLVQDKGQGPEVNIYVKVEVMLEIRTHYVRYYAYKSDMYVQFVVYRIACVSSVPSRYCVTCSILCAMFTM